MRRRKIKYGLVMERFSDTWHYVDTLFTDDGGEIWHRYAPARGVAFLREMGLGSSTFTALLYCRVSDGFAAVYPTKSDFEIKRYMDAGVQDWNVAYMNQSGIVEFAAIGTDGTVQRVQLGPDGALYVAASSSSNSGAGDAGQLS
jgi:hypothetical protein